MATRLPTFPEFDLRDQILLGEIFEKIYKPDDRHEDDRRKS